jgi:hypothetical protein
MANKAPTFKIIGAQYAGKEGFVTAVYDQELPDKDPHVFRNVRIKKETLKDATQEALRLTKRKGSKVVVEFLPAEALFDNLR